MVVAADAAQQQAQESSIISHTLFLGLQLSAIDQEISDVAFEDWLFEENDIENVDYYPPTPKNPGQQATHRKRKADTPLSHVANEQRTPKDKNFDFNVNESNESLENLQQQPAAKKRKLEHGSARPPAAKGQRSQEDEDTDSDLCSDDNSIEYSDDETYQSSDDSDHDYQQQQQPEPPSQAQKTLPLSSTTRPIVGQKSPCFLEQYEKGLVTAEQIQQCILNNKPTTSPMHDEESSEHHSQDLVCLWTDCGEETCFSTPEALHEHLKIVHSKKLKCDDDKRFHCSFNNCSKSYTVKENLINHFHDHSGFRVSCQECGQTFKNESTLRQHNTGVCLNHWGKQ